MNLKDIAKEAGVSAVTVSNVINGNHHKVSKETIERVQKIIAENNYTVNATARSLAKKKSNIICVVIPYLSDEDDFASSPYYSHILAHLEKYIRNRGYYMMTRGVGKCSEVVSLFATWNVDGIIFLGAFNSEEDGILEKLRVPMVFVDSYNDRTDLVSVGVDDYKGGYLAARYLIGKGHRDIFFVGPHSDDSEVINARYNGFCEACKEKDVPIGPNRTFYANTFYDEGVRVGKEIAFAKEKCTAVAAMSDILAIGIMAGLRMSGLNVPEDISIIGFDGIPEGKYAYPALTTVSQNLDLKAKAVGDYLFRMIEEAEDNEKESSRSNEILDVEIVEGQSVKQLIY